MKIVIYGASVTAQKGETGYFEQLTKLVADKVELVRLPFGASHLQFAGLAMIQKVLDEKPDYCILDWVTPSTNSFPDGIVDRINTILLVNRIIPIWVLFPRNDDTDASRECCQQVIATQSELIKVFNFQLSDYRESDLSKILRDVVHTNLEGAKRYSRFIYQIINENCFLENSKKVFPKENKMVPKLITCEGALSQGFPLNVYIKVLEEGDVTLYSLASIGPASPVIELQLLNSGKVLQSYLRNVVDPWCYYERLMLLNFPSFKQVPKGDYSLRILTSTVEPFETIETLKPIPEEQKINNHCDRFLNIMELVIDGAVEIEEYQYGV